MTDISISNWSLENRIPEKLKFTDCEFSLKLEIELEATYIQILRMQSTPSNKKRMHKLRKAKRIHLHVDAFTHSSRISHSLLRNLTFHLEKDPR